MKKIIYIVQLLSVVFLMGACAGEELKVTTNDDKGIPFTLEISNKTATSRAAYYTEAGATGYNENVINRADVFFYTDQTANAIYKISKTWTTPQEQSATLDGTIPSDILNNVSSLYAYAVVNGPQTPDVNSSSDTKIATLKQIGIEADFTTYTAATTEKSAYSQTEFVMDGEDDLTIANDKKSISGTIRLNRAASKIALFIQNLTEYIDGDGNTWTPQETGMSISFYNGVKASRINVGTNDCTTGNYFSLSENPDDKDDDVRFSLSKQVSDNEDTDNIDESKAYTHFPFYSYSSNWGRDTNPDQEAYLSLRIYWQKTKDKDGNVISGTAEPYYYRVPINLEDYTENGTTYPGKQLQRNTYYKVLLEVGVLGDKSENSQVELTPNYIVANWNDEPIEVQLADYHYLVVEKNFVEMFNQESVTIGYESCENVTAEIVYMARPNFTGNTITTNVYHGDETNYNNGLNFKNTIGKTRVDAPNTKDITTLLYNCEVTHNANNRQVTLNHKIQNNNTEKNNGTGGYYDHAIYTIVIRLKTDCGLTEYVEIKQYPARYIEGERDVNDNYSDRGTVFINGYGGNKTYDGTKNTWYWVNNTLLGDKGSNSNPNMYVVTITSFDKNQKDFIIADPRETDIDNLATSGWKSAPSIYGTSPRTLSYYYPTKSGNDYANYIAPKFRVTSAYGRLRDGSVSGGNDKRRCAAFQEAGYPAGRWRLPTAAELNYIGKLCADGVIPALFNNGASYNSASGAYKFNSDNGTFSYVQGEANSVRCVYDEWYWTDKCDKYTFTWGDQPR